MVSSSLLCRDLPMGAIVMAPMRRYMRTEIEMSSAQWVTAQMDTCLGKLSETSDIRSFFQNSP